MLRFFSLSLLLFVFRIFEALFLFPNSASELDVFFTGYRFDLLILSFLLIPIVFVQLLFNFRHKLISQITRSYLLIVWIFVSVLYFLNGFLFSSLKDRIWLQDWVQIFPHVDAAFDNQSVFFTIGIVVCSVALFYYGRRDLMDLNQSILNSRKRGVSLVMLLILGLFARGSLGQDHLRRNDCDFKSSSWVRAFCLNPVYTFSKLKNTEF